MRIVAPLMILLPWLMMASSAFAVDDVRCGNRIVSVGDSRSRVLRICGDPAYQELLAVEQVEYSIKSAHGKISTTQVVRVEQWTYDQGRGYFLKLLTFRNGRLSWIEYGDRM